MAKIAFLFPGQGSQYVGMGKELYDNFEEARKTFDRAGELLGFDYRKVCFAGPAEELKQTYTTQPTIFLVARACARVLTHECDVRAIATAGHSLGEYNALVFAGAMHFEEALKAVRNRGIYMHEASLVKKGTMAAIIGLELAQVEALCAAVGDVQPAALNSPGQVVVSGTVEAVEAAAAKATEAGAKKAVVLKVSGAWHSQLMKPAEDRLAVELNKVNITKPLIPIVANTTADFVREPEEIRAALLGQLCKPVRWVESIQRLTKEGVDTIIDVGPGNVVKGLVKRIDRSLKLYSVADCATLEKTLAALKEG